MNGKFITFEGCEGAGKTTQINLLHSYLKDKGKEVTITREPGGTNLGNRIRAILLNPDNKEMNSDTELLLYYASRSQLVNDVIKPGIEAGKVVLCDRYCDSSFAYQHYGRGLERKSLEILTENFVRAHPDLTILIDLPIEVGFARRGKALNEFGKLDRIEAEAREFHERVRLGYLDMASKYPKRIKVVDGRCSEGIVFSIITSYVNKILER